MNEPAVLQQQITNLTHSALGVTPTCFFPEIDNTLGGLFVVVDIPVSSILNTLVASDLQMVYCFF